MALSYGNPAERLRNRVHTYRLARLLDPTDVLLASYPRSGNTWLRLMLADLLGEPPDSIDELNAVVFDIYKGLGPARSLPFRIVKTHEPRTTGHRFVYLVRQPEDALASYYHYHRNNDSLVSKTTDGIDDFVVRSVPGWVRNVRSYLDGDGLVVTFDELRTDTVRVVSNVCDYVGIPVDNARLEESVERRSFETLQDSFDSSVGGEDFFRSGVSGAGRGELSATTRVIVDRLALPMYRRAQHRA